MARSSLSNNKNVLANKHNMKPSETKLDLATLVARGFTARFTGFVSGSMLERSNRKTSLLQPLSNDEIEKDLRHMNAYETAALRYQQHHYAQVNRISAARPPHAHPGTYLAAPPALPIRLDPDHDKRLAAQRKQMARAEVLREALEQEYVAIRAHYVETCQQVQQLADTQRERLEFLQALAQERAQQMAYTRTRLQMARDTLGALEKRQRVLLQHAGQEEPAAVADQQHILLDAWMEMEQIGKDIGGKASSSSSSSSKKSKIMPWKSMTEPATPMGVPLLLSASSLVPEKSVAWLVDDSKMKGSIWGGSEANFDKTTNKNQNNLVWMTNHLPVTVSDDQQDNEESEESGTDDVALSEVSKLDADDKHDEAAIVRELRRDVSWLEQELVQEGKRNAEILSETAKFRHRLDESTTMMTLLRQETEAVLYRHNVLLADPTVMEKVEALADAEEDAASNRSISPMPPPSVDEGDSKTPPPPPPEHDDDGANFGDDEGDGTLPGKRPNAATEVDSPRKRRKV